MYFRCLYFKHAGIDREPYNSICFRFKAHLMFKFLFSLFLAFSIHMAPSMAQNSTHFNVRQYDAKGDGLKMDTKAINKTIEAAVAAGGGTVYFPAGKYLTGSIRLKSNIHLYLAQGAVIIAADAVEEYDKPETSVNDVYQDFGHSYFNNSLIWGRDLHDISITGPGLIWGKGLVRENEKGDPRPNKSISLFRCRNVNIRDISMLHAGWFGILATGVDNFTIDNVKMDTNRDGIDVDACQNVRISNCSINSPLDDAICLKSSFALGYARATENVTITNCQVSGYDEGSFLDGTFKKTRREPGKSGQTGRIKMGTESNGGFKNITITNCVFDFCRGLALETVDGGLLEDVTISNITMRDVLNAPIFLRLASRMRGPKETPVGELRRIIISNVVAYNVELEHGVIISGVDGHDIKDILLKDIKIYYKGGGTVEQSLREVPGFERKYPEPFLFGTMPSYGFFMRNVEGIELENIDVSFMKEDHRPAFILDKVKNAEFRFVTADKAPSVAPLILKNTQNIDVYRSFNIKDKEFDKSVEYEKVTEK